MSKGTRTRFVAIAVSGKGWRIQDNLLKRFWGEVYVECPYELIDELNAAKRPEALVELQRREQMRRRK